MLSLSLSFSLSLAQGSPLQLLLSLSLDQASGSEAVATGTEKAEAQGKEAVEIRRESGKMVVRVSLALCEVREMLDAISKQLEEACLVWSRHVSRLASCLPGHGGLALGTGAEAEEGGVEVRSEVRNESKMCRGQKNVGGTWGTWRTLGSCLVRSCLEGLSIAGAAPDTGGKTLRIPCELHTEPMEETLPKYKPSINGGAVGEGPDQRASLQGGSGQEGQNKARKMRDGETGAVQHGKEGDTRVRLRYRLSAGPPPKPETLNYYTLNPTPGEGRGAGARPQTQNPSLETL